jgi:hypothetical protein
MRVCWLAYHSIQLGDSSMNKILTTGLTLAAVTALLGLPAFAGIPNLPPVRVPEPATAALMACGLGAVALARRFRKK